MRAAGLPGNAAGRRKVLAAVLLGALAAPAAAEGGDDWETSAFARKDGCYTAHFLDGKTMLGFHLLTERREFRLTVAGPQFARFVADGNRDGPMEVRLEGAKGVQGLTARDGHIIALDDGMVGIAANWFDKDGAAARKAVVRAQSVTLSFAGERIGTFPLANAPGAIAALEACLRQLGRT